MQGVLIVVTGILLMYLVLSGKLDCLIAAFRACAGTSGTSTDSTKASTANLPDISSPTKKMGKVLSI